MNLILVNLLLAAERCSRKSTTPNYIQQEELLSFAIPFFIRIGHVLPYIEHVLRKITITSLLLHKQKVQFIYHTVILD